jgi:hypothetical protein
LSENLSSNAQTDVSKPTSFVANTVIMAAQAALIADTITGMKRALRRERESKLQTK